MREPNESLFFSSWSLGFLSRFVLVPGLETSTETRRDAQEVQSMVSKAELIISEASILPKDQLAHVVDTLGLILLAEEQAANEILSRCSR